VEYLPVKYTCESLVGIRVNVKICNIQSRRISS